MMMGLAGRPSRSAGKLMPKERHGVKTMSIGYLLDEEKPVVWRGPMVHKLIEQFLGDVEWGELDYLLVDMPPGTGDAQLSLAQIVPLSGAVLVTTPQAVSTFDVAKAIAMFKQVNVEILGIVENMAGYAIEGQVEGARAGTRVDLDTGAQTIALATDASGRFRTVVNLFGSGGAERLAQEARLPGARARAARTRSCASAATRATRSRSPSPTRPWPRPSPRSPAARPSAWRSSPSRRCRSCNSVPATALSASRRTSSRPTAGRAR